MLEQKTISYDNLKPNEIYWLPTWLRNHTWAVFDEKGNKVISLQPCSFLIQDTFPKYKFAQPEGAGDRVLGMSLAVGYTAKMVD